MTLRGYIAAVLAGLALFTPVAAEANTTIIAPPESGSPYQAWIEAAMVPTPELSVEIVESDRNDPAWPCEGTDYPDPVGCVVPSERRIFGEPRAINRSFVFHELGHIFDSAVLTDWDRERFSALARIPMPWWYEPSRWHQAPAEYFAESYALCAIVGPRIYFPRMTRPDDSWIKPRQHYQICTLIQRASERHRPYGAASRAKG